MVVSLLHKMQVPNNCFTLSLCDSNSCKSNSWRDDHVTTHWYRSRWWRSWCRAGDDRDHDSTLEMEIKGARWSWPYHVTYFDCIWCLSVIHLILALIDGSILRWSLTKFQDKSVLPEYAPLRKFFVLRHHVMIGCDRLYVQIQRVQNSCARGILRLNLTSLAYTDMASEHRDRKVERESYSRYDQHSDVHHWKLLHLTWWSVMV